MQKVASRASIRAHVDDFAAKNAGLVVELNISHISFVFSHVSFVFHHLSADRIHRPFGLNKSGRIDFMPFFLGGNAVADGLCDGCIVRAAP